MVKHKEMNAWEKGECMYHRGMMLCNHEWGGCGFAVVAVWRV